MLEYRLTEHDDFTDYFVLVESSKTFSAKPKPLYATENLMRFAEWQHKLIIGVLSEEQVQGRHGFGLELFSRECAIKKVKQMYEHNMIDQNAIISCTADVDEIS